MNAVNLDMRIMIKCMHRSGMLQPAQDIGQLADSNFK